MLTETNPGALLALGVMLFAATGWDLRCHRIPNGFTLGGALMGLLLQGWSFGVAGLFSGMGGLAVGIAILLPFYALKGMGAGDVKLMGAVGAFLGPLHTVLACGLTLLAGLFLALGVLAARRGLMDALRRYATLTYLLPATRDLKLSYTPPGPSETTASTRFPYAAAIASGSLAALWWLDLLEPVRHLFMI